MEESLLPIVIDNIGPLFARGPAEKVAYPYATDVRNCKYIANSVRMRFGLTQTAASAEQERITGITNFSLHDVRYLVTFNSNGSLEREANEGYGNMELVASGLGAGTYADMAQAYEQLFIARTNLNSPAATPKVYYRYNNRFYLDDVAIAPNSVGVSGAVLQPNGDIPAGNRYCIVLFETRSGYISGATEACIFGVTNTNENNVQVQLTGVPLGPANTVRRWIAFTEAGADAAGPYFAITESITLLGLNAPVTATKIDDNVTTQATFNFTDDLLVAALPIVTEDIDFFDKIVLPAQKSVFYSPSTKRMFWCGESSTIVRVSEPDDPETYFGSTGYLQPGDDGDPAITVREFRNEVYVLKSNSGYLINPSNDHPNKWGATRRWLGSGPSGPWAVDVSEEFMAYAARHGLSLYTGSEPETVTESIKDIWNRINWSYGHLIWVTIDHDENEIHVGVPLDNSTVPNVRLTAYYGAGRGPNGWSLKWSIDDIAAHRSILVDRNLPPSPNPQVPVDSAIRANQILVATSEPTGAINMLDPTSITDNGSPINQVWQSPYVAPKKLGIYGLNSVDVMASGVGIIQPYAIALNSGSLKIMKPVPLLAYQKDVARKPKGGTEGERFAIRITNNNQPDSAFNLARVTLYMQFKWVIRVV